MNRCKSSKFHRIASAGAALGLLATLATGMGACGDPEEYETKILLPPSALADQAAQAFHAAYPGSRILFSQNSGEILLVDGRGQSLLAGNPSTPEAALEMVEDFVQAHPDLYRVADPERQIQLAEAFRGRDKVFERNPRTGVTSLRFWYVPGQYPDPGRYGIAFFNASGALTALVTEFHPEPVPIDGGGNGSEGGIGQSQQGLSVALPAVAKGWTRIHDPGLGRVVDMRVEREQFRTVRVLKDPQSGEILARVDETAGAIITAPEGWETTGTLISTDAPDTLRASQQVLSTSVDGGLVFGFRLPGIHADGEALTVGDAAFGQAVPLQPIATDQAAWSAEPAFSSEDPRFPGITLRDATRLAQNLETTLLWYDEHLGWKSWDGQGGTFSAGIRGHRRPDLEDQPSPRAYGGNGYLLINGGRSATGVPVSHALDIVAHEFAHSVVTATADFGGGGEPGALNEALADVLGTIVKGYSNGTVLGLEAGHPLRDVARPSNMGHPETYGEYRIVEEDGGGIHTNCGVMNHALSLAIQGHPGRAPMGEVPMAELLLESMRFSSFSPLNTLEGFAATLSVSCRLNGRPGCDTLESAFQAAELLDLTAAVQ